MDLIDACYLLREKGIDADCRIVGEGPLRSELGEHITHSGLQDRVHLLGGLPLCQVLGLLREWADVFALPCVIARNGDRDGIPVSLAEAMAMELPVVTTDIVGIRELVQQGTGILVPSHDPSALAGAIVALATLDQTELAEMGRKGREVVDREFNLLEGTRELAGLFSQAVGKGNLTGEEKVRYVSS
jgi:colanic acid/amylovoran biosynthesis glycosyltransferase